MRGSNFRLLERGSNSEIFLYEDSVVLKMVDIKFGKQLRHLRNEFELMKTLSHPHVLKVLGLKHNIPLRGISDPHSDCRRDVLLLEFANGGSLLSALKAGMPLAQKKALAVQLVDALGYLHLSQQIAHRDIKLDNVLVRKEGDGSLTALVSDFGFAVQNPAASEASSGSGAGTATTPVTQPPKSLENGDNSEQRKPFLANSYKGTRRGYMAPELHRLLESPRPYDPFKVDVFSLAVVLFCLFFERLPFEIASPQDPLYGLVADGRLEEFWGKHKADELSHPGLGVGELKTLLEGMLAVDPTQRLGMQQVHDAQFTKALRAEV